MVRSGWVLSVDGEVTDDGLSFAALEARIVEIVAEFAYDGVTLALTREDGDGGVRYDGSSGYHHLNTWLISDQDAWEARDYPSAYDEDIDDASEAESAQDSFYGYGLQPAIG